MIRRASSRILIILAGLLALVCYMPQLLAFPYRARIGETVVRSERPLTPRLAAVLVRADALVARSPLYAGPVPRSIFLTTGGWRWRLLALQSGGAFAFRRPLRNLIVINDADVDSDTVLNGRTIAGMRTLHDTIAHETTHILITDHFGALKSITFPSWKVEGYADHVAGAGSLDDAAATRLRAAEPNAPALRYYDGRKTMEAILAKNPSVDRLFQHG